MKKYFVYELKKSLFGIGCIAIAAVVLYVIPVLSASGSRYPTGLLAGISAIGGVIALGVPVWLLSYKMRRRSVDLYYALPLPRVKILSVRLLVGLIAVFAPYTLAYLLGAIVSAVRFSGQLRGVIFLANYLASLIPILIIYAVSAFVFTRANSFFDGIVFLAFWGLIMLLFGALLTEFYIIGSYVNGEAFSPYGALNTSTRYFMDVIQIPSGTQLPPGVDYPVGADFALDAEEIVGLVLCPLMGIGSGIGLFLLEPRSKAEQVGQISDSLFGYKSMLPAYTVLLMAMFDLSYSMMFVTVAVVIVLMFALTAIYRHTVKIGWKQAVVYGASILVGLMLGLIVHRF